MLEGVPFILGSLSVAFRFARLARCLVDVREHKATGHEWGESEGRHSYGSCCGTLMVPATVFVAGTIGVPLRHVYASPPEPLKLLRFKQPALARQTAFPNFFNDLTVCRDLTRPADLHV